MASPLVAQALEAMMAVAITGSRLSRAHALSKREQTLRDARTLRSSCGEIGCRANRRVYSKRTAGLSFRAEQNCFPASALICPPRGNRSVRFADHAWIGARKSHIRLADPSEISALDFKGEIPRFESSLVSATIGINWSIFDRFWATSTLRQAPKNTVSTLET